MRYSFVLATLAVSGIATPYINVEVSEPGELLEPENRGHGRHYIVDHHGGCNQEDKARSSWFSGLWGSNAEDDEDGGEDDRDRRGRRHHRHRSRSGRRRHSRSRDDRERDNSNNDDQSFSSKNWVDDLFGSDYECVIQAEKNEEERHSADECCRDVGGELYDLPGHVRDMECIFRDVFENPRDEWRNCALKQRGANFADCYYREKREVDDSLRSRRRHHGDHSGSGHERESHLRHQDGRQTDLQSVFNERLNEYGYRNNRNRKYECDLELGDEDQERKIVSKCCSREHADGKLTHDELGCQFKHSESVGDFKECAMENGIPPPEVECHSMHHDLF